MVPKLIQPFSLYCNPEEMEDNGIFQVQYFGAPELSITILPQSEGICLTGVYISW